MEGVAKKEKKERGFEPMDFPMHRLKPHALPLGHITADVYVSFPQLQLEFLQ